MVTSFKGKFEHSVDEKGRVNIPAKLRKSMTQDAEETFTITRGFGNCLFAFPQDKWIQFEAQLAAFNDANPEHRYVIRLIMGLAVDSQLDRQSRIMIPKNLLELASIDSEILIVGALDRLELWNPRMYQDFMNSQSRSFDDIAQNIFAGKKTGSAD